MDDCYLGICWTFVDTELKSIFEDIEKIYGVLDVFVGYKMSLFNWGCGCG